MPYKVGICQMRVQASKAANLERAATMVETAARQGAAMAVLPEMFNCPYEQSLFAEYAETEQGETAAFLAETARKNRCLLVGGSIPERQGGQLFNTTFVFDQNGKLIARHRKVHLFDIAVPGGITFQESAVLTAGDQATVFSSEFGPIGLAICYDLRFPEFFRLMVDAGAQAVILPAAFNMTTGPAHWETLLRTRAIDNQVYIIAVSPARDENANYVAYGHSLAVDPWGVILWQAGAEEAVGVVELDARRLFEVREQLPLLKQRRADLY
jgi:omega-amidase